MKEALAKDSDEVQYAHAEDSDSDDVLLRTNTQSNTEQTNITGNKTWITKLDESVDKVIKFADGKHMTLGEKKDIFVVKKDGQKANVTDVLYVPSMTSNLISVCQLLARGYNMKIEKNHMKVYHSDERLILKAPLAGNKIFKVEINPVDHKCLASTVEEDKNW